MVFGIENCLSVLFQMQFLVKMWPDSLQDLNSHGQLPFYFWWLSGGQQGYLKVGLLLLAKSKIIARLMRAT